MKIAHVTTFGPNNCGLYESSANIAKSDFLNGNIPYVVDTGISPDLKKGEPKVGAIDERGSFKITTQHYDILNEVDIIVMHTYCQERWIMQNQTPIIWVVHGRPAAAFRQDLAHEDVQAFSAYGNVSKWPRIKKMLYFWPEYKQYWDIVIHKDKHEVFDYPPVDEEVFSTKGKKFEIQPDKLGKINGLICDPRRDDIDRFDVLVGAYQASKEIPGIKWHFFGLDTPIKKVEQRIIHEIRELGCLGTVMGRVHTMQDIYRAFDFLYTPHSITTQIVMEAASCGLKIIANNGNKVASQTINTYNPKEVISAIRNLDKFENKKIPKLKEFGKEMNRLYEEVLHNEF